MRRAVLLLLFVATTALLCVSIAVCHQTTADANNNNNKCAGGCGGSKNIFLLTENLAPDDGSGSADEGVGVGGAGLIENKEQAQITASTVPEESETKLPHTKQAPLPKVIQEKTPTQAPQTESGNADLHQLGPSDHNPSVSSNTAVAKSGDKTPAVESEVKTPFVSHNTSPDTTDTDEDEPKKYDVEEKKEDEHSDNGNTENKSNSEQNNVVQSDSNDNDAGKQSTTTSLPAEVNPTSTTTTASNTSNDAAGVDIFGTVRGPFVLFLLLLQITF